MSEQVSLSLSEENVSWLDANYNNRSGYVDDLLTQAREGSGTVDAAIKEYQLQQLRSEIEGMKAQLDTKKSRLNTLKSELESEEAEQERLLEDAKDALEGATLAPDNPAVKNWADKVDLTPEELIAEVEDER